MGVGCKDSQLVATGEGMEKLDVLDKGYVRLAQTTGSDLSVVNAARVSYDKQSNELTDKDRGLIRFLLREGHTSPFRHASVSFEVYAPLMVARQWYKYIVGSDHTMDGWNESSRRYITEEPAFYIPGKDEWRTAPENSKQGSGEPLDAHEGTLLTVDLMDYVARGEYLYERALARGVCAEQARLFLPAYGMYVRWWWTASLQSVLHFLNQRMEHDAQKEIQLYAQAVRELVQPLFPATFDAAFPVVVRCQYCGKPEHTYACLPG